MDHLALQGRPHRSHPGRPVDLGDRAAGLVAGHYPTSRPVYDGPAGVEEACGCCSWFPVGWQSAHLGREVSLLARGYFDLALQHGQVDARDTGRPAAT